MVTNMDELVDLSVRTVEPDGTIPDNISITELAEDVVRGKRKLSQAQMRMLIELLPYYAPKLTAIADLRTRDDRDFAVKLEKAITASEKAKVVKMIEARVIEPDETD